MVHKFSLICIVLLPMLGCGDGKPPKYALSGTVTFGGMPVPDGSIMFQASDKRTAPDTAAIVDGKYALELTAGQKLVMVEASKFVGPEDKTMGVRPRDQYLPHKYNVESKLTMEVKPQDGNVYDLPLQK
jgi:hypothetical protein